MFVCVCVCVPNAQNKCEAQYVQVYKRGAPPMERQPKQSTHGNKSRKKRLAKKTSRGIVCWGARLKRSHSDGNRNISKNSEYQKWLQPPPHLPATPPPLTRLKAEADDATLLFHEAIINTFILYIKKKQLSLRNFTAGCSALGSSWETATRRRGLRKLKLKFAGCFFFLLLPSPRCHPVSRRPGLIMLA